MYKSTDGGGSWSQATAGLPPMETLALAMAIDPSNSATLYAGTQDGVYKSADGGESWKPLNTGLPATLVFTLAIDPSNPATLYAGTEDGVFRFTSADPTECLFVWAEGNYPAMFAPFGAKTAFWDVYTYRYYTATNAYLGVSSADNHVYYKAPDGNLQDEGPVAYWLPQSGCQ